MSEGTRVHSAARRRRVFLLGIDGLPPATLRRFAAEGVIPRFAHLLERAAVYDVVPTLPALTAPGWLTIASGAHPSTIGVENILLPTPGLPPDALRNGFDASFSRAEYLWETFDRCGRKAIVLKYPGSWPPRPGSFVQIDGAGGYADISCRFEALSSRAYVTGAPASAPAPKALFPQGYEDLWRIDTGAEKGFTHIECRSPTGWQNMPEAAVPHFEFVIRPEPARGVASVALHALAFSLAGESWLAVSRRKNISDGQLLQVGDWSHWIHVESEGGGYAFRLKLIALDVDAHHVHLYQSEGHRLTGFSRPASLAGELIGEIGPVVEWTGTYDVMNGLIGLDTQFEIYEQHTDWLASAIKYLAGTQQWDAFFTHWHVIEYAHHLVGGSLHHEHPLHEASTAARDIDFLRQVYALADRLLAVVEQALGPDDLLVVASDHGHDLVHTLFYLNQFLRRRGWLSTSGTNTDTTIDWSRSVAYGIFPGGICLNRTDAWSGGIVREDEVETLKDKITQALRDLCDPQSGRHPVKIVLDRGELAVFGHVGPQVPDLFFCMDRGYEPATRLDASSEAGEFEITLPYSEVTSGHGSFFPASTSARTMAFFAGRGINHSVAPYPIPIVDLAPTIAGLVGIEPPRNCDGRPLSSLKWAL